MIILYLCFSFELWAETWLGWITFWVVATWHIVLRPVKTSFFWHDRSLMCYNLQAEQVDTCTGKVPRIELSKGCGESEFSTAFHMQTSPFTQSRAQVFCENVSRHAKTYKQPVAAWNVNVIFRPQGRTIASAADAIFRPRHLTVYFFAVFLCFVLFFKF